MPRPPAAAARRGGACRVPLQRHPVRPVDPAGWDAALSGAGAVYIVPPSCLSGPSADAWGDSYFGLDMRSAEEAVRTSALEWTVLRSADFAQKHGLTFTRQAVSQYLSVLSRVVGSTRASSSRRSSCSVPDSVP